MMTTVVAEGTRRRAINYAPRADNADSVTSGRSLAHERKQEGCRDGSSNPESLASTGRLVRAGRVEIYTAGDGAQAIREASGEAPPPEEAPEEAPEEEWAGDSGAEAP